MKEIGLPFMAPMVRAVLADAKTKTRRAVKNQPEADETIIVGTYHPTVIDRHGNEQPGPEVFGAYSATGEWAARCPYGRPGDRLWVRENWRAPKSCDGSPPRSISDSEAIRFIADETVGVDPGFGRFRPGMFMCRWMSRILLENVSVRVEHLQDISEADALAEGITRLGDDGFGLPDGRHFHAADPRISYLSLWEAINGDGSVEANPWVWVVEFKRIAA